MKKNLARKTQQQALPEGTEHIATCFKDSVKANDLLLGYFASLTADISNKDTSIDEWELVPVFVNKVAQLQEDYLNMGVSELDIDILEHELEELKAEFNRELDKIRSSEPKDSQTRAVQKATAVAAKEQITIHDIPEPTPEDLAELEEELGDMPSDEELIAFMREAMEKE